MLNKLYVFLGYDCSSLTVPCSVSSDDSKSMNGIFNI